MGGCRLCITRVLLGRVISPTQNKKHRDVPIFGTWARSIAHAPKIRYPKTAAQRRLFLGGIPCRCFWNRQPSRPPSSSRPGGLALALPAPNKTEFRHFTHVGLFLGCGLFPRSRTMHTTFTRSLVARDGQKSKPSQMMGLQSQRRSPSQPRPLERLFRPGYTWK